MDDETTAARRLRRRGFLAAGAASAVAAGAFLAAREPGHEPRTQPSEYVNLSTRS